MNQRALVSGMGVITPIGIGIKKYWEASLSGTSGVGIIASFDASPYPTKFAAEIKPDTLNVRDCSQSDDNLEAMGNSIQFAVAATKMAMADSGLDQSSLNPDRVGVVLGVSEDLDYYAQKLSSIIYQTSESHGAQKHINTTKYIEYFKGAKNLQTEIISSWPDFAITKIASDYHIQGPCYAVNTACSSSSQAIGEAFRIIQRGEADVIICGGTQSLSGPAILLTFSRLNTLSANNAEPDKASRPFDAKRDGFVLGEGAGILILESAEHALKRKANIYGEVIGFGAACDAYRVTDDHPEGRGAIHSMKNALSDAGIQPADIDYINAHGTSTLMNDRIETLAIKRAFGEHAYKIPVSSSKSMIGHLLAAGGAVELITCFLAMRDSMIPPTINYKHLDPDCDLDYVPNQSRKATVNVALSNSFGFGGQCNSLAIRKFTGKLTA